MNVKNHRGANFFQHNSHSLPPPPQLPPSPRDACLYCVTIKLPVYLMEIYTEEIIAPWSHDLDPVSHESRQLINQCFPPEPEPREILLLSSSEQREAVDFRRIRLFVEDLVRRDSSQNDIENVPPPPHTHTELTCFPARTSHSTGPARRDILHSSGTGYTAAPSPWKPAKETNGGFF